MSMSMSRFAKLRTEVNFLLNLDWAWTIDVGLKLDSDLRKWTALAWTALHSSKLVSILENAPHNKHAANKKACVHI